MCLSNFRMVASVPVRACRCFLTSYPARIVPLDMCDFLFELTDNLDELHFDDAVTNLFNLNGCLLDILAWQFDLFL